MLLSDLISKCQTLLETHGDAPVVVVEFNEYIADFDELSLEIGYRGSLIDEKENVYCVNPIYE